MFILQKYFCLDFSSIDKCKTVSWKSTFYWKISTANNLNNIYLANELRNPVRSAWFVWIKIGQQKTLEPYFIPRVFCWFFGIEILGVRPSSLKGIYNRFIERANYRWIVLNRHWCWFADGPNCTLTLTKEKWRNSEVVAGESSSKRGAVFMVTFSTKII